MVVRGTRAARLGRPRYSVVCTVTRHFSDREPNAVSRVLLVAILSGSLAHPARATPAEDSPGISKNAGGKTITGNLSCERSR